MRPQHRNRRLATIALSGLALAGGVALLATALESNRQFFYPPSAIAADGFVAGSEMVRVGGLVVPGTLERGGDLRVRFGVSDFEDPDSPVLYVRHEGVLPDLFKEDSGVVVTGRLLNGELDASEVLAKHDENYRPILD